MTKKTRAKHTAQEVAEWFLAWADDENHHEKGQGFTYRWAMSKGRLNYLLFKAEGHWMCNTGKPLFSDEITVTKRGPVVQGLFDDYGTWDEITHDSNTVLADFSRAKKDHLKTVWKTYRMHTVSMLQDVEDVKPFKGAPSGKDVTKLRTLTPQETKDLCEPSILLPEAFWSTLEFRRNRMNRQFKGQKTKCSCKESDGTQVNEHNTYESSKR